MTLSAFMVCATLGWALISPLWGKIVQYVHVLDPVNIVATSISYLGFMVGKKCSEFVTQNYLLLFIMDYSVKEFNILQG